MWWVLKLKNYTSQYQQFLRKLRQARVAANLKQQDVAAILGKPQSFVSKCETGERRVDFIEVLVLAEIYNQPLSFFFPEDK